MNRRQLLSSMSAGMLGVCGSRAGAAGKDRGSDGGVGAPPSELTRALRRFAEVDWQRFAVMSKASGEEPPWRLRLEAEYQAAHAAAAGTDELLRYSEHASPHVRSLAAQMLGVTGASRSQERLRTLLATDPAAIVRNYAVEALSRLPAAPENAGVTAAIAGALKDANGNVRFSAQQAQLRLQKRVPGGAALLAEWTRGFDPRQLDTARVGGPAPAFALTSDAGQTVRLADFRSRKTVVLLFQLADW